MENLLDLFFNPPAHLFFFDECPGIQVLQLHRQAERRAWLGNQDKRIVVHFTPFHGSWLNLVEIWFGILARKVLSESFSSPDELKQSIEAFAEQWNLLFAHPFNWSYDGKGLHEKAVRRFVRMLERSPEHFELRTLTKSMKLMANLLQDYRDEVSAEVWESLATTMADQSEAIASFIRQDEGPRRRIRGANALAHLMDALNQLPHASQQEAA